MMTSGVDVRVGIVGAGPAGLLVANVLVRAGLACVVYERLPEEAVRARTRAGLIEARTVALLGRHGLAAGLHRRGTTSGVCEFRRAGVRHVLDYGALAGAVHHVYPQQLLVADLLDALRAAGGHVCFGCPVAQVRVAGAGRALLVLAGGEEVACEFVLGCDGFHGVTRAAVQGAVCSGVDFGAQWLSLLAEVPPASDRTVYGLHPDGFAGQMLRSASVSRFYLQVAPGADPAHWTEERIWEQLAQRLDAGAGALRPGTILERGTLELRSYVTEPMHAGPVFLAGDAAHIVTPAGGKGMNLALQDADELVAGLLDHYQGHDNRRLHTYSTTRCAAVWHAVEFSHWMLDLLLARPAEGRFREGLREARLARLLAGGAFAQAFARAFVGSDGAA